MGLIGFAEIRAIMMLWPLVSFFKGGRRDMRTWRLAARLTEAFCLLGSRLKVQGRLVDCLRRMTAV